MKSSSVKSSSVFSFCRGPIVRVSCCGLYCFESFEAYCSSQRAAFPILRKNGWLVRYFPEFGDYRCYCPDCRKAFEARGCKKES